MAGAVAPPQRSAGRPAVHALPALCYIKVESENAHCLTVIGSFIFAEDSFTRRLTSMRLSCKIDFESYNYFVIIKESKIIQHQYMTVRKRKALVNGDYLSPGRLRKMREKSHSETLRIEFH